MGNSNQKETKKKFARNMTSKSCTRHWLCELKPSRVRFIHAEPPIHRPPPPPPATIMGAKSMKLAVKIWEMFPIGIKCHSPCGNTSMRYRINLTLRYGVTGATPASSPEAYEAPSTSHCVVNNLPRSWYIIHDSVQCHDQVSDIDSNRTASSIFPFMIAHIHISRLIGE